MADNSSFGFDTFSQIHEILNYGYIFRPYSDMLEKNYLVSRATFIEQLGGRGC